jgi:hypothetical protein
VTRVVLAAFVLALGLVTGPWVARVRAAFNYAFVQAATGTADASTFQLSLTGVGANNGYVYSEFHNAATTGSIVSDQSDAFETPVSRDQSGYRLNVWPVCDAVGGTTQVTVTDAGQTAEVETLTEFSGIDPTSCIQASVANSTATGNSPFATDAVAATGAALIHGTLAINDDPTVAGTTVQRAENSNGGIYANTGDKRASGAGNFSHDYTFASPDRVIIYVLLALGEDAGGPTFPFGTLPNFILRGGGRLVTWIERLGFDLPPRPVRVVQSVTKRGHR